MITFANIFEKDEKLVSFGVKEIGPYYWVGTCRNGVNYFAGQTFRAPAGGVLKRIKLFSSIVYGASNATISIYSFDNTNHAFKEKQSQTTKYVSKANESQWIEFDIPNMKVDKDSYYAFKIQCAGGMLAVAECPWNIPNPYEEGVEWIGSSSSIEGSFYKDFDLAFEGEIEASPNAQFV